MGGCNQQSSAYAARTHATRRNPIVTPHPLCTYACRPQQVEGTSMRSGGWGGGEYTERSEAAPSAVGCGLGGRQLCQESTAAGGCCVLFLKTVTATDLRFLGDGGGIHLSPRGDARGDGDRATFCGVAVPGNATVCEDRRENGRGDLDGSVGRRGGDLVLSSRCFRERDVPRSVQRVGTALRRGGGGRLASTFPRYAARRIMLQSPVSR